MNDHLAKARDYIERGDDFYARAADEIIAAKNDDPTLGDRKIGEAIGKSAEWVRTIVRWRTTAEPDTPVDWRRGSHGTRAEIEHGAKRLLRENPAVVTELPVHEQRQIAQKLDEEAAKREHTRKQEAKQKERDHLGDETVDDLELREELQSVEYLLITARGNLRGFVKRAGELGVENTPEKWRESCLDWIEDLEGHLGMAKALLDGNNIDWAAFDALLAKE